MQQFSRVCMLADHDQTLIEYVCIFPECNLNRLICGKCVKIENHRHQKEDYSHVLDNKKTKQGANFQINPLKQIIQIIQNSLQNITNMIEQMEKGMDLNFNCQQLYELLMKVRNNGLNQFDDIQLNMLMNIDKQVGDIYIQLSDQSNHIIQNAIRIQEWCQSQQIDNCGLLQKIKDSNHNLITQDQVGGDYEIHSSTISNDVKYIVSGGSEKKLKIWNYSNNKLVKSIQLDKWISYIKFTDDSKLLYVAQQEYLIQFDVNNNFKELYKSVIHSKAISNIFCITNTIILTSSFDKTIIKTVINLKYQLLLIKAHDDTINGLDYNHNLNMIASSSYDKSIKIWNGKNGQLVLEKQNAHNNKSDFIYQVTFIKKKNQLISLDSLGIIIIWTMNYETKQLEYLQLINDTNGILNISLVLICREYIKIYSLKGDYISQFNHNVKEICMYSDIQPQQMKAIIIQGKKILQICKVKLDLD